MPRTGRAGTGHLYSNTSTNYLIKLTFCVTVFPATVTRNK
jgi:hypothetical protein